jgi:predicted peptidase
MEDATSDRTKLKLSRRAFAAIAVAIGSSTLWPHLAAAQQANAARNGPKVNSTVFFSGHIKSVSAVTEVFGRGQRTTAAIVEYGRPIRNGGLATAQWTVDGRTVTAVYANDTATKAKAGKDGRFVILELDPEDEGSETFAPNLDQQATTIVTQVASVQTVDGQIYEADPAAIINTRQINLIVDDFQQFRFVDPDTGLLLAYNLFIPRDYDGTKSYPLVLFMHDLAVTGTNPLRTLEQGLGAISFASPEDQARHPAFVLAPQYPVALANDESQVSEYPDITVRLIKDLTKRYRIDERRLYATGQSGGCMASIALNIKYPDLFAASLLVAGQWDAARVAPMATSKLWIIVSQDDDKAWPGMNALVPVLEENGAKVTRGVLNGRSSPAEFEAEVADILRKGSDSNVFFTSFQKGTVIPVGVDAKGGAGHIWTWPIAYRVAEVRDWLLRQEK